MNSFGKRLKDLRGSMSQADLATALQLKQTTLSNYERGRNEPNFETLQKLCSHFGVKLEWLVFGTGPMQGVGNTSPPLVAQTVLSESGEQARCPRCEKLEGKLEKVENQRDDAVEENRQLHRDKAELLKELGELRATVARLEERKNRLAVANGISSENSGAA